MISIGLDDEWFCVKLKPGQLKIACYDLNRLGFTIFNPTFMQRRVNARRQTSTEIEQPLFPNYLFTPLNLDHDHWERIRYCTRGVKELLGGHMRERPTPVPMRVMRELLDRCSAGPLRFLEELTLFRKNQQVRIIDGPLTGEWARVEWSERDRVGVLLSIFGRDTPVTLKSNAVEAVVRV